ncbi:murein L,D-transpeptidase catalytic domain family protein [Caulobacter segnis]
MWAAQDRFFDLAFLPARPEMGDRQRLRPGPVDAGPLRLVHPQRRGSCRSLRSRFPERDAQEGRRRRRGSGAYVAVRNTWLATHPTRTCGRPPTGPATCCARSTRGIRDPALLPILVNGTPVDDQDPPAVAKTPAMPKPAADAAVPFPGRGRGAADPPVTGGSRPDVLRRLAADVGVEAAAARLIAYRDKYRPTSDPRYWAVVNFDLHSATPRLFLFDCVAGIASAHLCAHGRGSEGPGDDGYAEVFSNEDGSNCSSLGIYHCDVTYIGEHGKALYLDGLEATNANARRRHIVMHGADYVASEVIKTTGRIGRSLGCPAIEMGDVGKLIPALQGGSLLIIWKSA